MTATAEKIFAPPQDDLGRRIVVRDPSDQYSDVKYVGKHRKTGLPVVGFDGREVETTSRREYAQIGAFLKHAARRGGIDVQLNEHERGLLNELAEKAPWAGRIGGVELDAHDKATVKALIDDSTSGGLEATPIVVDNNMITFPLLNGELFPLVNLVDLPRGRRVEASSIDNVTVNWGGGDDTDVTLFNTANMVQAIDTSIFTVDFGIEVGRDFLADAAVNVGQILTQIIGERMAAELDKVIADGNGTTQPTGVMATSGVGSVSFGSAAPTVGGYESLLFSVGKEYRGRPGNRFIFCSNETTYSRAMAIAVGAADARRVFGAGFMGMESHEGYSLFGRPYKICNDLANTESFCGDMSRYRLYRRLGMSMEWHTQGKTLARRNLALLIVRARYGGQAIDADAFTICTTHQS